MGLCSTSPPLLLQIPNTFPTPTPKPNTTLPFPHFLHTPNPSPLLLDPHSPTPSHLHHLLPHLLKTNLYSQPSFQAKLVSLFSSLGALRDAFLVFHPIPHKPPNLYHTLLKAHAHHSDLNQSLLFFSSMKLRNVPHVVHNFTYLLKKCADVGDLRVGRQLHAQLVAHGFDGNLCSATAVVNLYAKCGVVEDACKVFGLIADKDLVCWNAMVAGFAQNGWALEAVEVVREMQLVGERPDSITVVTVLPACADLGWLKGAKAVHGYAIRAGFGELVNFRTSVLDVYAKCGAIGSARKVFDGMRVRNVVSWNSMIDGYVANGDAEEAMSVFEKMLNEGVEVTEATMMAALNACWELGDLKKGRFVHELLVKTGLDSDVNVMNCLITMYCKCKQVDDAVEVFENLEPKTLVSWNAMISGYAQNGLAEKAMTCFCRMQKEHVRPDSFTLVSLIPVLADVSMLKQAKYMHGYAIRQCLNRNVFVMTALVDMYAKCGGVKLARKLFDSVESRHITTWNAMIDGYGTHGMGVTAVELFEDMKKSSVQPNHITFLCVLSACSHAGLVDKAREYFASMKQDYNIEPTMDHYGSMVDVLGRAGLLTEAWKFIEEMPIEPSISVYGAMLGACKIHKNVELGEKAAEWLFELEPEEGGYHVLLANIYATASMWEDVARVRNMMEKKGLQKTPGCTFIELKNEVHTFYSGSTNHPEAERIYTKLEELVDEIKAVGYVPDTNSIHDVEDYVKVQLLNTHSEKLAIAFGLINTKAGTTIQIRKNLRVCGDCHSATKFISQVTGREIIVRDMHRFHHFKDGKCSCGDYW